MKDSPLKIVKDLADENYVFFESASSGNPSGDRCALCGSWARESKFVRHKKSCPYVRARLYLEQNRREKA